MSQNKIKIKPWSLFLNGQDLRKYMRVNMHEEDIAWTAEEYAVTEELIETILESAKIYLHAEEFPKYFEVDELEEEENEEKI